MNRDEINGLEDKGCPHCKGKCCRNDLNYKVEHMAAEIYTHDCDHCDDGTERNDVWLFIWYTGPGISHLVAMYPANRSVFAFDYAATGNGYYTIRSAVWTGGPLPKYDQTEAVG